MKITIEIPADNIIATWERKPSTSDIDDTTTAEAIDAMINLLQLVGYANVKGAVEEYLNDFRVYPLKKE